MNYYVSTTGNDSTGDGLSPSTAWRTIGKAIGASPAITLSGTGDTLNIAVGVYLEAVALALSPTSGGRLTIIGDTTGAIFGTAPGLVDWRAWTDNYTAGNSTPGICLSASSKNYVTLRNLKLIGGTTGGGGDCIQMVTCTNWTIQDCNLIGHYAAGNCIYASATAGVSLGLTIDRVNFKTLCPGSAAGLWLLVPKAGADWSLGVAITNCYFGGAGEGVDSRVSGGSGSFIAGGVAIQNCTFDSLVRAVNAFVGSTVIPASPMTVNGCLVSGGAGLSASAVGQVVEDGNILACVSPRANVAIGTNSLTDAVPAIDFGDSRLTGTTPRPYGEPSVGSPFLNWGNYGTTPAVDFFNQTRPATASVGCFERETLPGVSVNIFQVEG